MAPIFDLNYTRARARARVALLILPLMDPLIEGKFE